MAWNIEKFGFTATITNPGVPLGFTAGKLIEFVGRVISNYNADIVGIMEIVGGAGDVLANLLEVEMNNLRPAGALYTWHALASPRQLAGTQEEYIFLWQQEAGRLMPFVQGALPSINHLSFYLYGMLNDWDFDFIVNGYTAAQRDQFWQALEANGYRNAQYNVSATHWHQLQPPANAAVNLNQPGAAVVPPLLLTLAQRQAIKEVLVHTKPVLFTKGGGRPPFISDFVIGGVKRLRTAVLHAPNPSDPNKYDVINNLALINDLNDPLVNRLVMGDFNTDDGDTKSAWRMGFVLNALNNTYSFTYLTPKQHDQIFTRVVGAPLNMTKQMNNVKTSLTSSFLSLTAAHNDILASTYDNFYLARATAAPNQLAVNAASPPQVVDLVYRINAANSVLAISQIGDAAVEVFLSNPGKLWLKKKITDLDDAIKKAKLLTAKGKLMNQVAALKAHRVLLNKAKLDPPMTVSMAHLVYNRSISDHLPIMITLDY